MRDAQAAQQGQQLLGRVALGDAAQVEQHAHQQQLHRAVLRIQPHVAEAHAGQGLTQLLRVGQFAGPPRPPPQPHHRPDGHVEGPVRTSPDVLGTLKDLEQVLAHLDRPVTRLLLPVPALSQLECGARHTPPGPVATPSGSSG